MSLFLFYFFVTTLGMKKINIDNEYMQKGQLYNLNDSEYQVIQEIENGIMFFQIESADTYKYLFIELIFQTPEDGNVNFSFTINQNSHPSLKDNQTIQKTYADLNGDYLRKSYHNILIPAYSYNQDDKFYINNLKREEGITYKYKLRISKSDDIPCPNNCTSNSMGFCNFGICACEANRIDLDCSKTAIPIMLDNKIENMSISGTQYFYFQQKTQLETIQLDLEISNMFLSEYSQIFVYIMFENFIYGIATSQFNNQTFSFSSDSQSISKSQILDISKLNNNPDLYRFDRLFLSIIVPGTCKFNINISIPSEDSEAKTNLILIYLFVSLAVVLILTLIIVFLIKNRNRNTSQVGIVQLEDNKKQGISLQQFDQYLRKIKWSELDQHPKIIEKKINSTEIDACAVCQVEYQNKSICRVTPCGHIFHDICLQQWTIDLKHESCPMCREDLSEQTLQKFAQEIKNYKITQQSQKDKKINKNGLLVLQNQIQPLSQMIQN